MNLLARLRGKGKDDASARPPNALGPGSGPASRRKAGAGDARSPAPNGAARQSAGVALERRAGERARQPDGTADRRAGVESVRSAGAAPEPFQSDAGEALLSIKPIETEADLADAVSFSAVLSETLGLSAHLYAHICPLEVSRGAKAVIVLVTQQHGKSDDLREVLKLLAQKGYVLRPGPHKNVFVTASALLLAVAKGQLAPSDLLTTKRLQGNKVDSALWGLFVDVVTWAFNEKTSDIHVNVYPSLERSQIKFTVGGKYVAPERWALPSAQLQQMLGVAYQKGKGGVDATFMPNKEQQCNIFMHIRGTNERVMLRWASMATDDGPQVTMRLLQLDAMQNTISLEQLGYMPSHISMLNRAMKSEGGAVIIAGVVGSGKSTTLATVMGSIPQSRKVMTLEDPREYIIPHSHANTISRPLDGSGDEGFNAKLRTLKRSAFNDLLLGEIRDKETGIVFQDVVLSGQNLYSTTHARRAIGIPDKLASPMVGVDRDALATPGALKLLIYQALLPVNCPLCKIKGSDMLAQPGGVEEFGPYLKRLKRLYGFGSEKVYFRNSNGCRSCRREGLPELNGFKGRTVVAEMLELDDQMLEHIKAGSNLDLQRYVASIPRSGYDDPNMDNKSTLECAIYKMSLGLVDPREIEPRFASFETIELRRQRSKEAEARLARAAAASLSRRLRDEHAGAIRSTDEHTNTALGALTD